MALKLKICGMRDERNIRDVAALSPDFMGFIFYPASPRYVGDTFFIPNDFPSSIKRTGVFVNESVESVLDKVKKYPLDFVQLHGSETPEQCRLVKEQGVQVIKVFSVNDEFDFVITKLYEKTVDYFLFDTKGKFYGGNAQPFNWQILKKYNQKLPFFLSGGLSPDTMEGILALQEMNLFALDVNSGAEVSPGVKDIRLIEAVKQKMISIQV